MFDSDVATRAADIRATPELAALAQRIWERTKPLRAGSIYVPEAKALLSQDGGVCARDGARLTFDPSSPDEHDCPQCGATYTGERHHRAWVWRYHLWLSERAIHFALLDALGVAEARRFANDILAAYAERYRSYPNRDNVLGPTRLFFSTYLESIWLIQIVIARSILDVSTGDSPDDGRSLLAEMVAESAGLIRSFNEGWSNRQVWNNTALIAAGRFLKDESMLRAGLDGPTGVVSQLQRAVSESGWWFEGENYHFFALRGFLLAAEFLRSVGLDLYEEPATQRLGQMYAAPLETLLPDLTLPARGDSPYDVSVVQVRFAELWEFGWTRTGDPRLSSVLNALYDADEEEGQDYGFAEIAEQEQNRRPARLDRTLLGWKSLLWMSRDFPRADPGAWQTHSTLVSPRGPVILRPEAGRYVGLECAGTGMGHGHPDRLHLTLVDAAPLLKDFGTGSYVSEALHWYRSALAHNAPLPSGRFDQRGRGWCTGLGATGAWSWCQAEAEGIAGDGTMARRTVVVGPHYVVDIVDLDVGEMQSVDLPIHPLGALRAPDADLGPSEAIDVGARREIVRARRFAQPPKRLDVRADEGFVVRLAPRLGETVWLGTAPGPPTLALGESGDLDFVIRRATGSGRWVQLYTRSAAPVREVSVEEDTVRIDCDRGSDVIELLDAGVRVRSGGEETALGGVLARPVVPDRGAAWQPRRPTVRCVLLSNAPGLELEWGDLPVESTFTMGREHYRRSESEYPGEDRFSARVGVCAAGSRLYLVVDVLKSETHFRAVDAEDPKLDNEHPDIHSDGLQVYVGDVLREGAPSPVWKGFLAVPIDRSAAVRVHPVRGTDATAMEMTGRWRSSGNGYRVLMEYDIGVTIEPGMRFDCAVVVNEMRAGRDRRAGQLASSGGGWVYLRGDRESRADALTAEVQ